jgi:hypothetical protein
MAGKGALKMSNISIELLNRTANKVAKREVIVQYGRCSKPGADAEFGIDEIGTPIIRLVPWNTNQKTYWAFLHELGHVCLGDDKKLFGDQKKGVISLGDNNLKKYTTDMEERLARAYADGLDEGVKHFSHLHKGSNTKDEYVARLMVLLGE